MNKRTKKVQLGIDADHTRSMLKNLANSLIISESIETTKSRAKAVVPFVERLITIGKRESALHNTRTIFDKLRNKETTKKMVEQIVPRFKERTSGFLRSVKTTNQKGDDSLLFRVSFVDFEPSSKRVRPSKKKEAKKTTTKKEAKTETKEVKEVVKPKGGLFGRFRGESGKSQVKGGGTEKAKTRSGI